MKPSPHSDTAINLGFQIAPMIDVVFVIMLFFMVVSSSAKTEQRLGLQLPGVPALTQVKMPCAEVTLSVAEDGSIALNDETLGRPGDQQLSALTASLSRLQNQSASLHDKLLVTVQAEEQATYQRVMDALDSLARANVSNVTFTIGGEED